MARLSICGFGTPSRVRYLCLVRSSLHLVLPHRGFWRLTQKRSAKSDPRLPFRLPRPTLGSLPFAEILLCQVLA
jgi:hypothetical protein